jgi:uncharacterized membrane protein YfcA
MTLLVLVAAGVGAGIFGSLLGLGGGILIVPILTLGFGLGVRDAAGVSLVAVIVTSSASASVYLQRHAANLRLGMSLELFTACGALVGGLVAFTLSDRALAALFAILLSYTAFTMARRRDLRRPAESVTGDAVPAADAAVLGDGPPAAPDPTPGIRRSPAWLPRIGSPETLERLSGPGYHVRNLGRGIVGAFFAGIVSAILGVGGGVVKVPVMNLMMGVPLRIATATSNLMIGVTGTASAVVYLIRGGIDPLVAGPVAVGVFLGATIGSRIAPRVDLGVLRVLFVVVMAYTAIEMILRALS